MRFISAITCSWSFSWLYFIVWLYNSLLIYSTIEEPLGCFKGFFRIIITLLRAFWPSCLACGILVPCPGMEPAAPAVEAQNLNHWTTREVLYEPFSACTSVGRISGGRITGYVNIPLAVAAQLFSKVVEPSSACEFQVVSGPPALCSEDLQMGNESAGVWSLKGESQNQENHVCVASLVYCMKFLHESHFWELNLID